MSAPRWFYPVVGACLVVLTAAGVWALIGSRNGRYTVVEGKALLTVLDTRTGRVCSLLQGGVLCIDVTKDKRKPAPTR